MAERKASPGVVARIGPTSPSPTETRLNALPCPAAIPTAAWTSSCARIAAICAGMRTLLEGWGCRVVTALSEEDLACQVDNYHAEADLLMAVNGWPTLEAVRQAGAIRTDR